MAVTGIPLPRGASHRPLLILGVGAVAILAVALAAALWQGGDSGSTASRATALPTGEIAAPTAPSTFYLFHGTQEGLDTATWMNGATFDNVVVIGSAEEEARFLRFVETANSFLLAGGLPGWEVVNLTP